MTKPRFLLSGGTGFLGKKIVPLLRQWADVDILSRKAMEENTIKADLTLWKGGLELQKLKQNRYSGFIHLAGLYDLSATREEVLLNNVVATSNALAITQALEIPLFANASTIAAATNIDAFSVSADDLTFGYHFPDYYAESKALSEQLIKNWGDGVSSRLNLRFGILVGDSVNGEIERIDGPYHTPVAMKKLLPMLKSWGKIMLFPGNEKVHLPIVPVNQAAQAANILIKWMHTYEIKNFKSFHLTPKVGLGVRELYASTLNYLNSSVPFLLVNQLPEALTSKIGLHLLGFPEEQLRYALHLPEFDSTETRKIVGENWCFEFKDYERVFWSGYEKYLSHR